MKLSLEGRERRGWREKGEKKKYGKNLRKCMNNSSRRFYKILPLNTAPSLGIGSNRLLKQENKLSETHFFLSSVLGWCIQWFVACALMLDDVLDDSVMRRGQTCWFRLPNVGMIAINDVILLWNHINRILRNHFRNQPYYADLLDLFNEVEFQTASGEMLDLLTTVEGAKDLSKFTLDQQQRISRFKTAYGTFYLPLSCALLMLGQKLDDYTNVKDILLDMGIYFQVQDDYLDCFGDPEKVGKDNYGKEDPFNVDIVKSLYNDLNLQGVFAEYEIDVHEKVVDRIETIPSESVQSVLKSFLSKIYRRNK
ncbi:hypothetical protein KSS87_010043 [Heliosperma pusillum]|nr:hypothetical protein KSS87_010043 [Heliosperma pusillum]